MNTIYRNPMTYPHSAFHQNDSITMTHQQLIDVQSQRNEAYLQELDDQVDNFLDDFAFQETEKANSSFHTEINDIDNVLMRDVYFDQRDLDSFTTFLGDGPVNNVGESSEPYSTMSMQGCPSLQQDINMTEMSMDCGESVALPCHPSTLDQYTQIKGNHFQCHDYKTRQRQQMVGSKCQIERIHSGMQQENEPMVVSMEDKYTLLTSDHPVSTDYPANCLKAGNGWGHAYPNAQHESVAPESDSAPFEYLVGRSSTPSFCAPMPSTSDPRQVMKRLEKSMSESATTVSALQEWDRQCGLPKSHSPTMVHSSRSRKQLQEGIILSKWNGDPLIEPISKFVQTNRLHQLNQ